MIIEPDFFEHWKVKALIDLTKRPESPLWLMRLWAHCQTRRTWKFRDLPNIALKSICGAASEIDADEWFSVLEKCRLIDRSGEGFVVHDWKDHNAGLVANWSNGTRPKKKRTPRHGPPVGKPSVSHGLPTDKPTGSQNGNGVGDRLEGLDRLDRSDKKEINPSEIYALYPKKVGRSGALKAIERALKQKPAAELIAATTAFAAAVAEWSEADRQFIPHPATWFNDGRFEDDPATWQRGKKNRDEGGAAAGDPKSRYYLTGGLPVVNGDPTRGEFDELPAAAAPSAEVTP